MKQFRIFDRRGLLLLLSVLLSAGFFATTLFGYFVSKQAIHDAIIGQDLPLTSSNIYSEIQKDLVRPVLISSTMANDTFLRDWVVKGETGVTEMARYLNEMKQRYGAFSSFFVSDKSAIYYTGEGVLKHVSPTEPRDAWYYRVRDMKQNYEINVDPDLANANALTIFINYRVFDFSGNYIGATGIGLTVDAVRRLIGDYQQRFQRTIYFVDTQGQVVLFGNQTGLAPNLRNTPGLGPLVDRILEEKTGSYQFLANGDNHVLNVNYLPELKWYLFVEQNEEAALAGIRRTLYVNLGISLAVTLVVLFLTHLVLSRYQHRIEEMASTDELTGLLNRHAFTILIDKVMAEYLSPLAASFSWSYPLLLWQCFRHLCANSLDAHPALFHLKRVGRSFSTTRHESRTGRAEHKFYLFQRKKLPHQSNQLNRNCMLLQERPIPEDSCGQTIHETPTHQEMKSSDEYGRFLREELGRLIGKESSLSLELRGP
jgi:hypothetical protein